MVTPTLTAACPIDRLSNIDLLWVQQQLLRGGYLDRPTDADGLIGNRTRTAFANFKRDASLSDPELIGGTSITLLQQLDAPHKVSEQQQTLTAKANPIAGTRSGKRAILPVVGEIYENEWIADGSYLTWGEMLRGFSRMPVGSATFGSEDQLVKNMLATAAVFKIVRQKFGSPIAINSAYRPYTLDIGASRSQHKYGRALDLRPLNGDFKKLLEVVKNTSAIKGIGLAQPSFLHVDIRPEKKRTIFRYA